MSLRRYIKNNDPPQWFLWGVVVVVIIALAIVLWKT